jgi:hypothetical protein
VFLVVHKYLNESASILSLSVIVTLAPTYSNDTSSKFSTVFSGTIISLVKNTVSYPLSSTNSNGSYHAAQSVIVHVYASTFPFIVPSY